MSGKTREQQLDELLDKQAIYELIMAYCNAADRHDHVKMRTLYHEDAIDDHGHFAKGLAMEFIDKLPEIQKAMEILHHNVTTVNLKLAGDRAEGEVGYRTFNRPFLRVWQVGSGRASAALGTDRAQIGGSCVGFRHRGATQRRCQQPCFADSRQRAERSPAGSWPHRIGLWLGCRLCGRHLVTRPAAGRALRAGSALAPARRASRSGLGVSRNTVYRYLRAQSCRS